MWCIQEITPEYRERMYDLLALYALPYDTRRPVVCIDEKSKQLFGERRKPILQKPGSPLKYDYEYVRNGTRNIFVAVEPKGGRRIVEVTKRRAKHDFARFVKRLVDESYLSVDKLRLVVDNLNTHFEKSFTETFPRKEADRILGKVEFHYTPKKASWLNMAEIELSALSKQCLDRRIAKMGVMTEQVRAWTVKRNHSKTKICWNFTKDKAREKLSRHYTTIKN